MGTSPSDPTAVAPPRRALAALARIARERVLGRLDRRRVIYRWRAGAAEVAAELAVTCHDRIDTLPATIFRETDPSGQPRAWFAHFLNHGARLWLALDEGRAIGLAWDIDSASLDPWYVPLERDARVIYGVVTPAWARGRGVAARLALAAARGAGGAPVYLDCMIWNRGARRAFAKAGFEPVGIAGTRLRAARCGPDA